MGTVFSFVDPTEMPYMIDLFLFWKTLRGLKNEDEETESRPVNLCLHTKDNDDRRCGLRYYSQIILIVRMNPSCP